MKKFLGECKLFYERNKIISILGIISMLIFISYIVTYNMPDIFGIEPLYNGLYNLSIGYIATMIFYIIQTYLPTIKSERKSFAIIKGDLETLYSRMSRTICIIDNYSKIEGDRFVIDDNLDFYYQSYSNKREGASVKDKVNCYKHFFRYKDMIDGLIDAIQKKSISGKLEDELVFLISKLQTNQFPKIITSVAINRWSEEKKELRNPNNTLGVL